MSGDRVTVSYTKLSEVSLFCGKGMLVLFDELSRKNSEFYPAVIRSVINGLDCNFFVLRSNLDAVMNGGSGLEKFF